MNKPITYRIEKLFDIFKVPKDRRAAFLAELPIYLEQTENIIETFKCIKEKGMKVTNFPSYLDWTDDGVVEVNQVELNAGKYGSITIPLKQKASHEQNT